MRHWNNGEGPHHATTEKPAEEGPPKKDLKESADAEQATEKAAS